MILGAASTSLIGVAARLGIADLLKDEPRSIDELAGLTGGHPVSLAQIMRTLVGIGVFAELEADRFARTPLSEMLQSDAEPSYRSLAMAQGSECYFRLWANMMHSVTTGGSAFEDAYGMNYYEYLRRNPDEALIFQDAMTAQSLHEATAMLEAYDFSEHDLVVDVGGGRGHLLVAILEAHPSLRGVLLDLPPVIEGLSESTAQPATRERCEFVGGNFFESVPPEGSLYIIKRAMPDKTDQEARTLLENIRDAMAPGGKVLVADPDIRTRYGKLFDVLMLGAFAARVRTKEEFQDLFADAGLRLTRAIDTNSTIRLFEAVAA